MAAAGENAARPRRVFRLHTVFAAILLSVLLLPLTGIYFFRLYENELVRQTESELIAQGVFMSAIFRDALSEDKAAPANYGAPMTYHAPVLDERFRPYPPTLDLRHAKILPPRPDARRITQPPDPVAKRIGKQMQRILMDAKFSTLSSMRILDWRGTAVAGAGEVGLSLAHTAEVARAMTGEYVSVLRRRISDEPRPALSSLSRGTDTRVFVAMPIDVNDRVVGIAYLSRSPRNVLKTLYEERESVFLAAFITLLMTTGIAGVLGYTIGKPLSALTRHAQQMTKGAWHTEKLPAPPIAELVSLTQSFEQMSSTIEARSEYIRNFALHVAHEFKTPLTSIQGAVELLNEHQDMEAQQRRKFLGNIAQDTDRLKVLVTRLLELARADVMQGGEDAADVAPILDMLVRRYAPHIEATPPEGPFLAAIAPDILETALANLIENSLLQGAQKISVTARSWESRVEIDVADDGPGVSEGNAAKLFTPFFTTRRATGGTGLGLVITRSLLKAFGGEISFVPNADGATGARFRLVLKAC